MKSSKSLWAVAAGLTAGAVILRRTRQGSSAPADGDRWLTVTINREPGDVQPEKLPAPLRVYGGRIETRVGPAPGDRGTELAVRLKVPASAPASAPAYSVPARIAGQDPRQDLRHALREAKALLETGEVLKPDAPPTTHRTPGGKLVGLLSRRSGGEGML